MKTFMLFVVLLVSNGLGAPVSELQELDKRRESTPEILNLEQELKKAAGEDKQYFSANEARPVPQIDGLAAQAETEEGISDNQESELPVNEAGFGRDDDMADITGYDGEGEPQRSPTYSQMWNIFQQNPDYFEDILQDYMNNEIEEEEQASENQGVKRGSLSDNDMISAGHYPNQYDTHMPADAKDRSGALMAEYLALVNHRHRFNNPEQLHDVAADSEEDGIEDVEADSEEDGIEDELDEDEHDEGNNMLENDGDEDSNGEENNGEENNGEENNGAEEDAADVEEHDNAANELDEDEEQDNLDSVHDDPQQSSKPWHDVGDVAVPLLYNM